MVQIRSVAGHVESISEVEILFPWNTHRKGLGMIKWSNCCGHPMQRVSCGVRWKMCKGYNYSSSWAVGGWIGDNVKMLYGGNVDMWDWVLDWGGGSYFKRWWILCKKMNFSVEKMANLNQFQLPPLPLQFSPQSTLPRPHHPYQPYHTYQSLIEPRSMPLTESWGQHHNHQQHQTHSSPNINSLSSHLNPLNLQSCHGLEKPIWLMSSGV